MCKIITLFFQTCSKSSWCGMLTMAAYKRLVLTIIDFLTTFLQDRVFEHDMFVRPPVEMKLLEKVLRLLKVAYGLVDALLH